ncbi:hypothetical protein [Desulfuromonas sp. TF]|uniref:hypothetical protein n=1 Tax=Desulfuromonas sp. TF TaxID=1232410 RepID=UPI0004812DD5|nr:hypothetical protein [Desulfuromonas sp. TF]
MFNSSVQKLAGKTVYLHIGIGKTGTSAIQVTLSNDSDSLLQRGYCYPKAGRPGVGHHNLAKLRCDIVPDDIQDTFYQVAGEFHESGTDCMVLSSEYFCFLESGYIRWISELFSLSNVKVVFYIRDHVDLILSTFLQWVKVGDDYKGDIVNFFNAYKAAFDYETRLRPWIDFFGEDSIILKLYDKKFSQDIGSHFYNSIGLNDFKSPTILKSNPSLLPEFFDIISAVDKISIEKKTRQEIVDKLLLNSKKFKKCSTLELIDPELKSTIYNTYNSSNERIANEYLTTDEKIVFLKEDIQKKRSIFTRFFG